MRKQKYSTKSALVQPHRPCKYCITLRHMGSYPRKGTYSVTHPFSSFQIFDILLLISYALEIGLSIVKLLWPEFFVVRTFQLHASTLMISPGILSYRGRSLFANTIPCTYYYYNHYYEHVEESLYRERDLLDVAKS